MVLVRTLNAPVDSLKSLQNVLLLLFMQWWKMQPWCKRLSSSLGHHTCASVTSTQCMTLLHVNHTTVHACRVKEAVCCWLLPCRLHHACCSIQHTADASAFKEPINYQGGQCTRDINHGTPLLAGTHYPAGNAIFDMLQCRVESADVVSITALFFLLVLMAATQDIAVDGWALTLLARNNVG